MSNGTLFCDFSLAIRRVVSGATGTEHVLAPGVQVVLEVVPMAVNEQYPSLMPTLYLGGLVTASRPFGASDAMRLAFEALANNETPGTNGENIFFACFFDGCAAIHPVRGPAGQ